MKYLETLKAFSLYISLMAIIISIGSCSILNKKFGLKDDHPLEQATEKVIKDTTGLDIDLSIEPKSKK
ncbi:MAG: hypothetical protein ACTSPI_13705 [Candidatus Heimdallarchaeaceae archaeon]